MGGTNLIINNTDRGAIWLHISHPSPSLLCDKRVYTSVNTVSFRLFLVLWPDSQSGLRLTLLLFKRFIIGGSVWLHAALAILFPASPLILIFPLFFVYFFLQTEREEKQLDRANTYFPRSPGPKESGRSCMEITLKDVSQVQDRRTYVSYSFDGVVPVSVIHVYGKIGASKLADAIDKLLIVSILHHHIEG